MRRRPEPKRAAREPTIALINIVFLMLIFFLIAGSIAPPTEPGIELVTIADLEGKQPAETLALHPDGRAVWQGADVDPETFQTGQEDAPLRLLPDQNLPAHLLIEIASQLQAGGASDILVVTERGLE